MVHIINEDLNIDIIFAQNCEKATLDLFIQLMQLLPKLPKLAEVKAYNNTWPAQQACTTTPSFPFFRRVAEAMDELLERSMEEMQSRKEPLAEDPIESELDSKLRCLLVLGNISPSVRLYMWISTSVGGV